MRPQSMDTSGKKERSRTKMMWKAIILGSSILKGSQCGFHRARAAFSPVAAGRHHSWSTLTLQLPRPARSSASLRRCALTTNTTDSASALMPAVERMRREAENEMTKVQSLYGSLEPRSESRRPNPTLLTNQEQVEAFLRDVDTVLFDCDGVLYRSPDPAPGARECLQSLLLHHRKQVLFVTNNAGTNRRQLRDKLNSILQLQSAGANGSALLTEDMMISSSYSAARYLQQHMSGTTVEMACQQRGRLYVIGSEGLCQELREAGFELTGGQSQPDEPVSMTREELAAYDFSRHHPIDAVVVGHDTELTFRKLSVATVLLQWNPGASLIATNEDSYDLVGADGRRIPGNGCTVKALEHSSGRRAVNVGKPSLHLADLIARETGCVPSRSVIVGDRLDTDIKFGVATGMRSLLVLTGVTTAEYLERLGDGTEEEPRPTHIMSHVGLLQ